VPRSGPPACPCRAATSSHVSGSGGWRLGVTCVDVRAPNNGTVVEAAQVAGEFDREEVNGECIAGFGPFDEERPRLGLKNGKSQTTDTRSALLHTLSAKQSSAHNSSTVPDFTLRTGTAPPTVQTYTVDVGRYHVTCSSPILTLLVADNTLVTSQVVCGLGSHGCPAASWVSAW
jgi:hypothetical protein